MDKDRPPLVTLSPKTNTIGVTGMGELELAPAWLVRRFGPPSKGDGFKVSGEYVFIDPKEEPFVLHDWKNTSLGEDRLWEPEELWASEELQEFAICTRDIDTREFEKWLIAQLDGETRTGTRPAC